MDKKKIINQAIDYILRHFDQDISVGDVADHLHFSKYYFCRMFQEATGESPYAFIKRLRMDQSAIDIKLEQNRRITAIGLDYGYSSSNYSSAFKEHHHLSPAAFRKSIRVTSVQNPFSPQEPEHFKDFDDYDQHMMIQDLADAAVVYKRFMGNYIELKEQWFRFTESYRALINENTRMIERFYHDPTITQLDQCICDLCITVDKDLKSEDTTTIKGGKFAIYPFEGRIRDIFRTLQGIFTVWLPSSGYTMSKRYGLNIYKAVDKSTDSVTMYLCIPIK